MMSDLPARPTRHQEERAAEIIAREAAKFIAAEAGPGSLITVIRAESASHGDHVRVFVSVFPTEQTRPALEFLARKRQDFSDHLKAHAHLRIPRVDFLLENGDALKPLAGGPGGN